MKHRPLIVFKNITKSYGSKVVIDNFNLTINKGSFTTILGPSGCGKSTILKMIGGFEQPVSGQILFNGLDIKDMKIYHRPTATVFQDYALFPTMNVFQNIAYGLKNKRMPVDSQVSDDIRLLIEKKKKQAEIKAKKKIEYYELKKEATRNRIRNIERRIGVFDYDHYDNDQRPRSNELFPHASNHSCDHVGCSCSPVSNLSVSKDHKWSSYVLKGLYDQLNDLDYYSSYWQTYAVNVSNKLTNKYMTRKITKDEINDQVVQMIKLVGLEGNENLMPHQLSGGMQQRAALARAIITLPQVLLLDEPLSALDAKVRKELQHELRRIHKLLGITFVLVTHDQEEALVLSDQIVVMSKGKIEQVGLPDQIYDSPANTWVSKFIGKVNVFDGIYLKPGYVQVNDKIFETDVVNGFSSGQHVKLMMRPEDFDVVGYDQGIINVYVNSATYLGKLWELNCTYNNNTVVVENIDYVQPTSSVGLIWDKIDVHVMHY